MGTARSVGITLEQTLPAVNEEAAFVAELRAGSQDAFAYLLAVYQNPVFNLVWHIVENSRRRLRCPARRFCESLQGDQGV